MDVNKWNEHSTYDGLRGVLDPNDKKGSKNILLNEIHWNAIKEGLEKDPPKRLLDFGCGIGRLARDISELGITYNGVDRSPEMIRKAQEIHSGSMLDFRSYDGKVLPFDDESFDAVLSCGVFQYLVGTADFELVLSEIHRILKPDGQLIMIEQASGSGATSGTVQRTATERDYITALVPQFKIHSTKCVRVKNLSEKANSMIRSPLIPRFLFKYFVASLAKEEKRRIKAMSMQEVATYPYYDFLMVTRKSRDWKLDAATSTTKGLAQTTTHKA